MKIKYFGESSYIELYDNIDKNQNYYLDPTDNSWIEKVVSNNDFAKESMLNVNLPALSASDDEYANAIQIHEAFKDKITPKQACNPHLWAYLSHCDYWQYSVERWISDQSSTDSIRKRFFCDTFEGNRIGLLRNSISRLWWIGELTYEEDSRNPYELTKLLLSHSDLTQSILERKFSMNKGIVKGILGAIKEINDDIELGNVGIKDGEYEWRRLCKYINRYGAVTLLDTMSSDEIFVLSYDFILNNRK